jgi:uncharacterized protein (TIGR02145 family)
MPDDPVGIVASVSQPADNFGSGNSSVPFTVTFKDNVKQLVVDKGSPAAVKLLAGYKDNNGYARVAYLDIRVQDAGCYCPARVPASVHPLGSLIFMCKNLGADYEIRSVADLDNITVSNFREYHGDWYRFGVSSASVENNRQYEGNSTVPGWNSLPVQMDTDWLDTPTSPLGNPCPDGWRIPTKDEWQAVTNTANNTLTRYMGTVVSNSWGEDNANPPQTDNYKNVLRIGDYLFLPAAGWRRDTSDGDLRSRGNYGAYWSSSSYGSFGYYLSFSGGSLSAPVLGERTHSYSVRCVQAE